MADDSAVDLYQFSQLSSTSHNIARRTTEENMLNPIRFLSSLALLQLWAKLSDASVDADASNDADDAYAPRGLRASIDRQWMPPSLPNNQTKKEEGMGVMNSAPPVSSASSQRALQPIFECRVSLSVGMPGGNKPAEERLTCEGLSPDKPDHFKNIVGLPPDFIPNNRHLLTFEDEHTEVFLKVPAASSVGNHEVTIPSHAAAAATLEKRKKGIFSLRRKLYNTWKATGQHTALVLRVTTTQDNKSPTESAVEMSDSVFGTDGDPVNLKSQMATCSYGQKIISAGTGTNVNTGVLEVSVNRKVGTGSYSDMTDIVNKATTAAQDSLGITSLSAVYDHVLFCLPPSSMPYIGYGWYSNYRTVYKDTWCGPSSILMHEIGHNLNLRHAKEGTSEYGDNVGYMGSSSLTSDTRRCYNAVNSVRLGWYNDREEYITDTTSLQTTPWVGKIIGVADYGNSTSGLHYTSVRIDNPLTTSIYTDLFVSYNHQEGMNANTADGANAVVMYGSYFVVFVVDKYSPSIVAFSKCIFTSHKQSRGHEHLSYWIYIIG